MNVTIPRPHDLYIRPLPIRADTIIQVKPPSPTTVEIAIRSQLREKGRMTLAQIVACIGDRTPTGATAHTSRAAEALERLVEIGAVDVRGKGPAARYSTMFGPNRDYDPEARERAREAATSERCASMIDREKIRANQRKRLKMEGK